MEMINESEKRSTNMMYSMVEFPGVKSHDKEYCVVYYEKESASNRVRRRWRVEESENSRDAWVKSLRPRWQLAGRRPSAS
ncbi:phosphatidylinositol 3-kinase catalytic subunit type 3 [Stigmatopora argus]